MCVNNCTKLLRSPIEDRSEHLIFQKNNNKNNLHRYVFVYLFNKLDSDNFYRFGDTFYNVFNMNKEMVVLVVVVVVVQSLILTHTL